MRRPQRHLLLLCTWIALGFSAQFATTSDGKKVLLRDDGTWELIPDSIPVVNYHAVDTVPKPLNIPQISYPQEAREGEIEGTAVVRALVDVDGSIIEIKVEESSGYEILDRTAIEALKKATFTPARHRGSMVRVWVTIPTSFIMSPEEGETTEETREGGSE